jgi:hypothetical protein
MADSEQKPEKTEKGKSWSLIREIVQFVSTLLAITISLFTIIGKINSATDSLDQMKGQITKQSSDIQNIKDALIKKHIINPK